MTKYNSKVVILDGIRFSSQLEALYYQQLKLEKEKGLIKDFELQPSFELQPTFKKNGKTYRSIKYIADFKVYKDNGVIEIIDCKGMTTDIFAMKLKMFEYLYPGLTLKVLKHTKRYGWETLDENKQRIKQTKKEVKQSEKG